MSQPDTSLLHSLLNSAKDNMGSVVASLCTLVMAGVIAFGNTQHNAGANDTKQADIERRILLLESDRATRAEVTAVKDSLAEFKNDAQPRLMRIESLLLQDLQFHRTSH